MTNTDDRLPLDLDALVERARIESRRSDDGRAAAVLRLLADAGGSMPVADLLASGVPRETVAALVDSDPSGDKRKRPKVKLGFIGAVPVVWLTAPGWQATGRSSGREVVPSADSIAHAMAPSEVGAFLDEQRHGLASLGVTVRLASGPACRRWSEELVARAWARVKAYPDASGSVGALTGGLLPDALIVEAWRGPRAAEHWQAAWADKDPTDDDLAETTVLLEVEDSRKASEPLRGKVDRLDAAINLGAARACVWVVRSRDVWDRLSDLGVGSQAKRPRQYAVPSRMLGLRGDDLPAPTRLWWPVRTPWAAAAAQVSRST